MTIIGGFLYSIVFVNWYDHVILHLFRNELTASEMQFGFKEHHSTTLCSLIFTEVISTYVNNNSSVYSCLLDASKAFDLVPLWKAI